MQEEQERSEGNHLAHSGTGSLLSSQASPLSSKAHLSHLAALAWGHRREAREIRRGRWEGPYGTGGAGEKRRAFALPTRAQEACWAPR